MHSRLVGDETADEKIKAEKRARTGWGPQLGGAVWEGPLGREGALWGQGQAELLSCFLCLYTVISAVREV